jgi:hypothetical protein
MPKDFTDRVPRAGESEVAIRGRSPKEDFPRAFRGFADLGTPKPLNPSFNKKKNGPLWRMGYKISKILEKILIRFIIKRIFDRLKSFQCTIAKASFPLTPTA